MTSQAALIDIGQLHRYIVKPVHEALEMGGLAADQLVMGTGLTESRFRHIDQIERGGDKKPGPAYGFWQMEKATHEDHWNNYLIDRPARAQIVSSFAIGKPSAEQMQGNLYYAAAMCRIHYYRKPFSLPAPGDYKTMAALWKKYYNTQAGAGSAAKAEEWFKLACDIIH